MLGIARFYWIAKLLYEKKQSVRLWHVHVQGFAESLQQTNSTLTSKYGSFMSNSLYTVLPYLEVNTTCCCKLYYTHITSTLYKSTHTFLFCQMCSKLKLLRQPMVTNYTASDYGSEFEDDPPVSHNYATYNYTCTCKY